MSLVIISSELKSFECFVSIRSCLIKKSGIIPVVFAPFFIADEAAAPIIPVSPAPKTKSKLFSAIILPIIFAESSIFLFLPVFEPPKIQIFFFKISSNL